MKATQAAIEKAEAVKNNIETSISRDNKNRPYSMYESSAAPVYYSLDSSVRRQSRDGATTYTRW